ncbi:MAG: DNA-directed RNA polymerase subunit omega [Bacteroidota bacterium]|nr:DNA-directed RNA polymerase subunit omega [Bacteroidota bacterium]
MKERINVDRYANPRDITIINNLTGNLYESVAVLAKRANQLAKEEKEELHEKLDEFAPRTDNLEEIFDNREQMEISAHYERLPKASLVSLFEYLNDDNIYFRNPEKEKILKEESEKKEI